MERTPDAGAPSRAERPPRDGDNGAADPAPGLAVGSTAPASGFPRLDFRRACGQFATGVTVVTVRDGDGARGMTANSFTSVSLDPPLLLVSVDRRARTHDLIEQSGRFAISVLADAHRALSDRFAGRHGDLQGRFDDVPHHLTPDGLPILSGALASFVCRLAAAYPGGDHTLFVGAVESFAYDPSDQPLLFFRGAYLTAPG